MRPHASWCSSLSPCDCDRRTAEATSVPDGCDVQPFSSRACERGTSSCVVRHTDDRRNDAQPDKTRGVIPDDIDRRYARALWERLGLSHMAPCRVGPSSFENEAARILAFNRTDDRRSLDASLEPWPEAEVTRLHIAELNEALRVARKENARIAKRWTLAKAQRVTDQEEIERLKAPKPDDSSVVTLMRDMYERTCALLDEAGFPDLKGQCVQTIESRVRDLIALRRPDAQELHPAFGFATDPGSECPQKGETVCACCRRWRQAQVKAYEQRRDAQERALPRDPTPTERLGLKLKPGGKRRAAAKGGGGA